MPITRYSSGAPTSESANMKAIVEPIIAITLVRCCSRVRSAASAMATEEMAPAPCSMRAAIAVQMSSAAAPRKLPAAKMARPAYSTGFLPQRSDAMPKGICRIPCARP